AEFTIGEGELMAHDVPLGCAPDEYDDLISGTCSHLPLVVNATCILLTLRYDGKYVCGNIFNNSPARCIFLF
ncbi:hypothetical protein, partial [Escherichia coli]|uniref:hypothetical protein n=1 Tax=Escherichia coli TaxID=562 RepID=UPI001BFE3838